MTDNFFEVFKPRNLKSYQLWKCNTFVKLHRKLFLWNLKRMIRSNELSNFSFPLRFFVDFHINRAFATISSYKLKGCQNYWSKMFDKNFTWIIIKMIHWVHFSHRLLSQNFISPSVIQQVLIFPFPTLIDLIFTIMNW